MDTWSEVGDEKEPIAALKRNTAHRSLIQKIEAIIASYELQEKYSTKLSAHSLIVIENIIKTKPEFFRIVESTFLRNINNDEIMANDIPYIISIICQLYNLLVSLHIDSRNEPIPDTCNYILKFLISVIVREQLVKIDNETAAVLLILCCDNIIDACTKLLKLQYIQPMNHIENRRERELIIEKPADLPIPDLPEIKTEISPEKATENHTDCCC
jgi:hypothetical protein